MRSWRYTMPSASTHRKRQLDELACVHPNAAGLDIGSEEIVVAVPADRDPEPVRVFRTFTPDLHLLVAWLVACGIDTVAMESTGVFWIPIYELLEQHGITPYLVNARHVKTVPGRKSDWNDAQWLQKLHALGLLQASFRPDAEIAALRKLAQLRNPACKSSVEVIAKALTGTWKDELLFVLQQALVLFDVYTAQLAVCDAEIERYLKAMESRGEPDAPLPDLPPAKADSKSKNAPNFNARAQYARILGVDLVAVMGLSASSVQTIITEIGTDMSRFPSAKHFCAWLSLVPRNDISGGKV